MRMTVSQTKMTIIILILAGVIICGWLLIGYRGFRVAVCRGPQLDIDDRESLRGTSWDKYYDQIREGADWIDAQEKEEHWMTSHDVLRLHAELVRHPDPKGTVIMVHGYHTNPRVDFSCDAWLYYECGWNLFMIDQRAAGQSEGKYITYGVKESRDLADWCRYVNRLFGEQKRLVLAGLSMGAATVLMSCARNLPANVTGLVADSPFSSPKDIIQKTIQRRYKVHGDMMVAGIDVWCARRAKFNLDQMNIWKGLEQNEIPLLLAHGTADQVVPYETSELAAKNTRGEVFLLRAEGAAHGCAYLTDTEEYQKRLRQILD